MAVETGSSVGGGNSNIRTVASLLKEDGSWADSPRFQVPENVRVDKEEFFRSYHDYYRERDIEPPLFDEGELNVRFACYDSLQYPSSFNVAEHGDKISRAFQIGGDYEWRVPLESERLYSRPRDGFIAMPISHFKAGLRTRPHRFFIALFKQEFRCSPAQFSPNAIRLILWFIAACHRRKRQPTFKAFFSIFYVKGSRKDPFYELVQYGRNHRLGTAVGSHRPVNKPKCMKNWWHEFIMLRGGEWSYMPGFTTECVLTYKVPPELHTREVMSGLHALVHTFGEPWDVSEFYHVENLKKHNCELFFVYTLFMTFVCEYESHACGHL